MRIILLIILIIFLCSCSSLNIAGTTVHVDKQNVVFGKQDTDDINNGSKLDDVAEGASIKGGSLDIDTSKFQKNNSPTDDESPEESKDEPLEVDTYNKEKQVSDLKAGTGEGEKGGGKWDPCKRSRRAGSMMDEEEYTIGAECTSIDGRIQITPELLQGIAESYSPEIYPARVNIDHQPKGYKLGDVLSLRVVEEDGIVKLKAKIKKNDLYRYLLESDQKKYLSMEFLYDMPELNKPYLVGLAATDEPACLYVDSVKLSKQNEEQKIRLSVCFDQNGAGYEIKKPQKSIFSLSQRWMN